jgi:chlorophyllide a oxygenase
MAWIEEAPRVRVRSVEDRMLDELLELAVLNERLAGSSGLQPWQIRARLERIKMKRRNWEAIYHYITQTDAVATLGVIEELNAKVEILSSDLLKMPTSLPGSRCFLQLVVLVYFVQVEESLSDDRQSRSSVASLQKKLLELQQEVNAASEKLAATQARVEQNLQRVNELKAEAVGDDVWHGRCQSDLCPTLKH